MHTSCKTSKFRLASGRADWLPSADPVRSKLTQDWCRFEGFLFLFRPFRVCGCHKQYSHAEESIIGEQFSAVLSSASNFESEWQCRVNSDDIAGGFDLLRNVGTESTVMVDWSGDWQPGRLRLRHS